MNYKYICGSCGVESISDTPFEVKVDEERDKKNKTLTEIDEWNLDKINSDMVKRNEMEEDVVEYNKDHILKRQVVYGVGGTKITTFFGRVIDEQVRFYPGISLPHSPVRYTVCPVCGCRGYVKGCGQ